MITTPIVADPRAQRVAAVEAELAELVAAGVKVAVTAAELVELEEKGLVVELQTGRPVVPVFPLDRKGAAL